MHTHTACISLTYKQSISVDTDEEVKSPCAHTPHLPITVATLMKILKKGRTGAQAVHCHGNVDWEESIFHRKALLVGLLGVQCMWYQEKRRARRGKPNTLQQPEVWQKKRQDDAWKGFTFRWIGTVGPCSSQYVAGDKRRRVCVGATHKETSHT